MVFYFNTKIQKIWECSYSLDFLFAELLLRIIFKPCCVSVSNTSEVFIRHGRYAGGRPYVLGSLHHVDDGIDRQDDAHDADGSTLSGHQREGEEIAAHGHTGIADSGDHGDDKPQQHHWQCEVSAAVLHDEERGDKDKRRAAVHVDGGADGQYEA